MSAAGVRTGTANPLHWVATDPDVLWSPGNVSEAIPGVSTALNRSFLDDAVCRSTDPGWTSLFHLAVGVAVDLGGTMSQAARELGIPCLTCTGDGTRRVRTGDLVRLDGDAGVLQVLERDPGRGTG